MSEIKISVESIPHKDKVLNHVKECCIKSSDTGDLIFMLMYITSRVKEMIREDVSPEELLRILKYVINNNIVFINEDVVEHLESCLRKECYDNRPE